MPPLSEGSGETLLVYCASGVQGVLVCPLGWKRWRSTAAFRREHRGCLTTQDLEPAGCQTHLLQLLSS